jgi:FkbM family methyltransferase
MKQLIKSLVRRCGYDICRVEKSTLSMETSTDLSVSAEASLNSTGSIDANTDLSVPADAFTEMQRLCLDIKEPIIFDVGAHHGETAIKLRSYFPEARIVCFEPFFESFQVLKRNTESDQRITIFNFGLSNQSGTFPFHSNLSSATNSLLSSDELGSTTWEAGLLETKDIVQAQFKTMDAVLDQLAIPKIDILKLDVQGAEPLVLEGASTACKKGVIQTIYSEIITQPTYVGQKRFDEALAVYFNYGFDLHNIYNLSLTSMGQLRQVDAIFVRQL